MTFIISAAFDERDQAAKAVHALRANHFSDRELSVVAAADQHAVAEHERGTAGRAVRSGVWAGTALGAAVGGYLGLLAMALVPALPLLIVGGAAVGGLAGSMTGLGVASGNVKEAERVLHAGGALLIVRETDEQRARTALHVLEEAQARTIGMSQDDGQSPGEGYTPG
jgi:uncharacterized membrane protein